LVFVAAAAVAAFGSVGLLLAVLGWYRRLAVLGGAWWCSPAVPARSRCSRRGTAAAPHVVGVIAVVAGRDHRLGASGASHQVLIIRDGAAPT
jgi:hypothetical protein